MRPFIPVIAIALCFSCSNNRENANDERLADFDRWALRHLVPPDLSALSKRDSCNCSKALVNPVDTLVDMTDPITVMWPYFVKNYTVGELDYAIVKSRGDTTHFIDHAVLDHWKSGYAEYQSDVKIMGSPEIT